MQTLGTRLEVDNMHQPYGHLVVENMQKILKLQKRAARVILGADTKANRVQLFRKLDWVLFYHEAKVNRSFMVYKRLSGGCPSYMSQMLITYADISERPTDMDYLQRESQGGTGSFTLSTTRL